MAEAQSPATKKRDPIKWVTDLVYPRPRVNICDLLEQEELDVIGQKVIREYDIDKDSRAEWEEIMSRAMDLAKQVAKDKNFPWPGASNVKYPLLTMAAIQFAARAYPEIVQTQIVKAKVNGADPDGSKMMRGQRVADHMTWQLGEQMEEWEEGTDKLLHILPIMGICFRKTFYDPILGRNISDLALIDDVVIHYRAESLERARRVTHVLKWYKNDIYEFVAAGTWRDVIDKIGMPNDPDQQNDEDAPHEFYEQHRFLDLDSDGYQEPYIVTVHKQTSQVVRIVPRFEVDGIKVNDKSKIVSIAPSMYFTKYGFIPNPDGSFYDLGFGWLLNPLGESVNTILNQLVDAGTLANLGGGFISRGIRIKSQGQTISLKPGEWKPVDAAAMDLRQGIVPVPAPAPSPVLFQLLGMLIDAAKGISSVTDVMTGEQPGANVPATTTVAMIEQGLKVFSAIYKRIYRSLKAEFKKIYKLNGLYLDDQVMFNLLDTPRATGRQDYAEGDLDVVPVADPNMSTDTMRLARAQALMGISGRPGVNEDAVTVRMLQALKEENIEQMIIPPEKRPQPPQDPKLMEIQIKGAEGQARLAMESKKIEMDIALAQAQIEKMRADSVLAIAKAEAAEIGPQIEQYKLIVDHLNERVGAQTEILKELMRGHFNAQRQQAEGSDQSGGAAGVEAAPSDQGVIPGAEEIQGQIPA